MFTGGFDASIESTVAGGDVIVAVGLAVDDVAVVIVVKGVEMVAVEAVAAAKMLIFFSVSGADTLTPSVEADIGSVFSSDVAEPSETSTWEAVHTGEVTKDVDCVVALDADEV